MITATIQIKFNTNRSGKNPNNKTYIFKGYYKRILSTYQ